MLFATQAGNTELKHNWGHAGLAISDIAYRKVGALRHVSERLLVMPARPVNERGGISR